MVLVVPLALICVLAGPASGQPQTAWDPPKLADGQPDINGMWNNVGAAHTPLNTEPWTVAFPFKRDNEYQQFEYACHEGNYAVPNSLSGERAQEPR